VWEKGRLLTRSVAIESRDFVSNALRLELVGPSDENEVIYTRPDLRYLVGQLAPAVATTEISSTEAVEDRDVLDASLAHWEEADAEAAVGDPEDASALQPEEESIREARRSSLSSVGLSFVLDRDGALHYRAKWGEYTLEGAGRGAEYRRRGMVADGEVVFDDARRGEREHGRISVVWVSREVAGYKICSVFVVNRTRHSTTDGTDRLYQVELEISGAVPCHTPFVSRSVLTQARQKQFATDDLLYRDRAEYAVGHNVAASWGQVDDVNMRCGIVRTETMPATEARVTLSNETLDKHEAFGMALLAREESAARTTARLRSAFIEYNHWIDDEESRISNLAIALQPVARAQIAKCRQRVRRLNEGIDALESNDVAFRAFRFANEALGRAQARKAQRESGYEIGQAIMENAIEGRWWPFQLAFILSCIPEMLSEASSERDLVDVLFFPTGGGKTEAYLGLAAFALAARRLKPGAPNGGAGTAVLMRYTLRLLTTQQFARAATIICAAESIRRDPMADVMPESALPFSIGLWVGPLTPGYIDDAIQQLRNARQAHTECWRSCEVSLLPSREAVFAASPARGTLLPLTECPWCGVRLCVGDLDIDENRRAIVTRCPNQACTFSGPARTADCRAGIPLSFVDDELYRVCPSLIVATIDKFATLPFRPDAKALFGRVSRSCTVCGFLTDVSSHKRHCGGQLRVVSSNAPIELIIQDELHTITDTIGSIYGLYESAIEQLISSCGARPKYVGSTATAKDVATQVARLYNGRNVALFPPAGLEAGQTFFAREVPSEGDSRGRLYLGVYAPTLSRLSTLVAVLASLLASSRANVETVGWKAADPYLTIVGYFNTIRDLGGVKALLGDDVPPVMKEISERNHWPARVLNRWEDELTGRIDSSQVPHRLEELARPFTSQAGGVDVMTCTNMISVGVDVPRLGLMVVDGQPKSTSEYIQATSRVGRRSPGIVVMVYNSMRPRDVSHYEHFMDFHDSYYRYVEAGSITPFSDGAIMRYLPSAYTAVCRLTATRSSNDDASAERGNWESRAVVDASFMERVAAFGAHEESSVRALLDNLGETWASAPSGLRYSYAGTPFANRKGRSVAAQTYLLRASDVDLPAGAVAYFAAPRSMRNVEAEIPLKLEVDA
jgi:hypothetical protein